MVTKFSGLSEHGGIIPDEHEQPIALQFWDQKYRSSDKSEKTRAETLTNIANRMRQFYASKAVKSGAVKDSYYYQMVDDASACVSKGWFIPGGRILANYAEPAEGVKATMFNCFVSGTIEDSLEGILDRFKEAMITMKYGGGIGMDFSTIRPKGAFVKGSLTEAKGPVAFMKIWDAGCNTIDAKGKRRGAMMATLECDHPDIEEFIKAKREKGVLNGFNLSVLVTDDFMHAVANDESWDLVFDGKVYKTVRARDLWDTILKSNYEYAEPGVIFIDRINERNNLKYCETISATNPSLHGDELVMTSLGIHKIKDLEGKTFMCQGPSGQWWPAECIKTGENKSLLCIEFSGNRKIRCTPDHKWPVVNSDGSYTLKRTDELTTDDYILGNRREVPYWSNDDSYTREEGFVVGAIFGDGWSGQRKDNGRWYLGLETGERIIAERVAAYFGVNVSRKKTSWVVQLHQSNTVKNFLDRHPGLVEKEDVPLSVWNKSSEFMRGFIEGYLSTDGYFEGGGGRCVLVCKTKKVLKSMQCLLGFCGIDATIHGGKVKHKIKFPNGKVYNREYHRYNLVANSHYVQEVFDIYRENLKPTHAPKYPRRLKIKDIYPIEGKYNTWDIRMFGDEHVFPVAYCATGNCGEQPLGPYGACLLGSVNLTAMVDHPFSEKASFNFERFARAVRAGVILLDSVIDLSDFPLPEQERRAFDTRRMGIGITGLGSALEMLGVRYGSERAIQLTEEIGQALIDESYHMSSILAKYFGVFPDYDPEEYIDNSWYVNNCLSEDTIDSIAEHGLRNSHLTSIAPTGTMSLFLGNVSSGIEPVFCQQYVRNVRVGDREYEPQTVYDYSYYLKKLLVDNGLRDPSILDQPTTTVADLTVDDHLNMMAAIAPYIDSAISKTINIPADYPYEDFKKVYEKAYQLGLKGCTTYRPNDILGTVLESENTKKDKEKPKEKPETSGAMPILEDNLGLLDRPSVVSGSTFKIKWKGNNIYVTINRHPSGRLLEVFINSDTDDYQWRVVTGKLLSAIFRREQDISFVIKDLKSIVDPSGGQFIGGQYVPSLLWLIGDLIEQLVDGDESVIIKQEKLTGKSYNLIVDKIPESGMFGKCPECKSYTLKKQDGCESCLSCGYNKCG